MSIRNRTSIRRHRLSQAMVLAIALPAAGMVMAQEQASTQEATDTTTLDRVTVTGSRIKRAEVEGPSPVTVITRDDIDREGFQTVADMLETLTQNSSITFAGDLSSAGGFTPNAQVPNLRGLGPGYTLVLINGRRPAEYPQPYNADRSSVNIGAIPSSIIDRIEILAGGASAIYGSDAVAGVINVVLRENFDGNLFRLTGGTTTNGGGDSINLELTGGRTGDRWSMSYALQYNANEPIFGAQRDFLANRRSGPNPDAGGVLMVSAIDVITGRELAFPGAEGCARFGFETFNSARRGDVCAAYDDVSYFSILNKRENVSVFATGRYDVGDTGQFWSSVTWYDSKATASSGTETWSTIGDPFTTFIGGTGNSDYFYDPNFGTYVYTIRTLMPRELGGSNALATKFKEQTYEFAGGYRDTIGDRFDWEANLSYAAYDYRSDQPRLRAKAVHDYYLGPLLGYAGPYPVHELNVDRFQTPVTPEQYRSFATRSVNTGKTTSTQANMILSGDLFSMPAGEVGFATLLEYARQTLDLRSDPYASLSRTPDENTPYNLVNSGRTDGDRDRYAAALEFRVPIFNSLDLQLAGRYDRYNDMGSAMTYNAGLEWRPFDSLLVRGGYATSFRAPDLQMMYAQGYQFYSNAFDEYACRTGTGPSDGEGERSVAECRATGSDSSIYQIGGLGTGNSDLKEEKGKSFTVGFVWDVIDGMSLSVDYYRIKLSDAANTEGLSSILQKEAGCRLGTDAGGNPYPHAVDSAFCQQVLSAVHRQSSIVPWLDGTVQYVATMPYNTSNVETSGIDTSFEYRWDTDRHGDFRTELAYSVMLTDKYRRFAEDPLIDYRDVPDIYANQRSRVRGSVSWEKGDWTTTLFGYRMGSVWANDLSSRLKPLHIYNVVLTKKFGENVAASLIVNNVFDNNFRKDSSNLEYPFFHYWQGADPVGRSVAARFSYRF